MKFKLSEDKELTEQILDKLNQNKKDYGYRFCPCVNKKCYSSENSQDYVCPCADFRNNVPVGEECHCGLYLKTEM